MRKLVENVGDYSIYQVLDDDGNVIRYEVDGPDGFQESCSTLEEAYDLIDRQENRPSRRF